MQRWAISKFITINTDEENSAKPKSLIKITIARKRIKQPFFVANNNHGAIKRNNLNITAYDFLIAFELVRYISHIRIFTGTFNKHSNFTHF